MDSRYSFTDLFSKEVDKDRDTRVTVSSVVIPQIQRPYAQGRTDEVSTYSETRFWMRYSKAYRRTRRKSST